MKLLTFITLLLFSCGGTKPIVTTDVVNKNLDNQPHVHSWHPVDIKSFNAGLVQVRYGCLYCTKDSFSTHIFY